MDSPQTKTKLDGWENADSLDVCVCIYNYVCVCVVNVAEFMIWRRKTLKLIPYPISTPHPPERRPPWSFGCIEKRCSCPSTTSSALYEISGWNKSSGLKCCSVRTGISWKTPQLLTYAWLLEMFGGLNNNPDTLLGIKGYHPLTSCAPELHPSFRKRKWLSWKLTLEPWNPKKIPKTEISFLAGKVYLLVLIANWLSKLIP